MQVQETGSWLDFRCANQRAVSRGHAATGKTVRVAEGEGDYIGPQT